MQELCFNSSPHVFSYNYTFSTWQELEQSTGPLRHCWEQNHPSRLQNHLCCFLHCRQHFLIPGQLHHALLEGGQERGTSKPQLLGSYAFCHHRVQLMQNSGIYTSCLCGAFKAYIRTFKVFGIPSQLLQPWRFRCIKIIESMY